MEEFVKRGTKFRISDASSMEDNDQPRERTASSREQNLLAEAPAADEDEPIRKNSEASSSLQTFETARERREDESKPKARPTSISYTQQKILLQRQLFMNEDKQHTQQEMGRSSASNAPRSPDRNTKQRQNERALRDAYKQASTAMNLWWSLGVDPLQASLSRVVNQIQQEDASSGQQEVTQSSDEAKSSWMRYLNAWTSGQQ